MIEGVLLRPEAEQELIEAVSWYENRGRGLGAEFLRSLEAAIASLQRHPLMNPVVFGSARRAVLRDSPTA